MEIIVFLSIVIAVVAVLTSIVLVRRVKKQIAEMTDALVDVKNGNGNRRILSATNELTAPLPMKSMKSLCPMKADFRLYGRQKKPTASL